MKQMALVIALGISLHASSQNPDALINEIRVKRKIPMVGVAVIKADSLLYMKALGSRRVEDTELNATPDDYVHIASNAEAMTGFIAGKLVEEGIISWDTKFFELFPQWKSKANPAFGDMTL